VWGSRWEDADVVIEGDEDLQLAVRFALYHLMASVPDEGEAAVGARGLTGRAYRGHVFWDSDVYVLPFLAATHPAAARAMLEYRARRLPVAMRAARAQGREGARFAWESAQSGREVAPEHVRDERGEAVPVLTGALEEHVVADVAWAAACYVDWTGDQAFASTEGRKLLVQTARWYEPGAEHRRHLWQCKRCGYQASVTAGTVMHKTRTSLTLWFWAAYLVATHTPGISAMQLQRQLGISRYETAWLILQKLRRAMVAPERETLSGEVEVDETLVGTRREGRHIARRHGEKALVGVIVEVRGRGCGRLRLEVLPDASQRTLTEQISAHVAPGSVVHSDGWPGYAKLASAGYDHRPRLQRRDHPDAQKLLRTRTASRRTSRPGFTAPTAASRPSTNRSISMSSSSATTVGTHRGSLPNPCSASERYTSRPPAAKSPAALRRSRPDSHVVAIPGQGTRVLGAELAVLAIIAGTGLFVLDRRAKTHVLARSAAGAV